MDDVTFHKEQLSLLGRFNDLLQAAAASPGGENLANLAEQFQALVSESSRVHDDGPPLIARMLTTAPQLAESFPRETLWYLGGECLHFMPDEEIERYSALDEQRREAHASGRDFDWSSARAAMMKLQ